MTNSQFNLLDPALQKTVPNLFELFFVVESEQIEFSESATFTRVSKTLK